MSICCQSFVVFYEIFFYVLFLKMLWLGRCTHALHLRLQVFQFFIILMSTMSCASVFKLSCIFNKYMIISYLGILCFEGVPCVVHHGTLELLFHQIFSYTYVIPSAPDSNYGIKFPMIKNHIQRYLDCFYCYYYYYYVLFNKKYSNFI